MLLYIQLTITVTFNSHSNVTGLPNVGRVVHSPSSAEVGNSVVSISLSGGQNALVASVRGANSSSIVLSGENL